MNKQLADLGIVGPTDEEIRSKFELVAMNLAARSLELSDNHESLACRCPESKLGLSVLKSINRLAALLKRLEKAEKTKQARKNIGVNPPCVKSSSPES